MISVCMATYNGEKYIKEQLESILCQLGSEDEVIVSDDGSKDNTLQTIATFIDKRICLLNNCGRHGFVGNFENALKHVRGDIILLADQDDVWKPNKIEVVKERLQHYDIVIHDAEMIDGDGYSLGKTYYSTMHHKKGFLSNLWKTRWLGCCMAFKREVLEACLPFPQNIVGHDYWIGMLGMLKFHYCFMDDILMSYRRHGGNVSPSGEKSNNSLLYMVFTKRYNLIIAILKRFLLKR